MSVAKRAAKSAADEAAEANLESEGGASIGHRLLEELFGEGFLSAGPLRWYQRLVCICALQPIFRRSSLANQAR